MRRPRAVKIWQFFNLRFSFIHLQRARASTTLCPNSVVVYSRTRFRVLTLHVDVRRSGKSAVLGTILVRDGQTLAFRRLLGTMEDSFRTSL